jgi:hypothetical protein
MKNLIIAIILGTLALFIWNAVSWMVLGLHDNTLKNIPESVVEAGDMKNAMPEPGVYHYPGLAEDADWEAVTQKMQEGPVISLLVFLPEGTTPFSPKSFLISFLLNLLAVGMAAYFLMQTKLSSFQSKALFVGLLGVFAGVVVELPTGSWYGFPAFYLTIQMIDYIVGWFLVGAILAWRIK